MWYHPFPLLVILPHFTSSLILAPLARRLSWPWQRGMRCWGARSKGETLRTQQCPATYWSFGKVMCSDVWLVQVLKFSYISICSWGGYMYQHAVQEWASTEAASLRCMVVHILHLCKRSATSRSPTVTFLKTFVMDLKLKGGMWYFQSSCAFPI